jgi:hypothetical protein
MTKGLELDRARLVPLICERLALGEPLAVICRSMSIGRSTVNLWRREDQSIAEQFDEARDDGYDVIAHRMRAVARGEGREGKDSMTSVQRDKLIVETDDKLLAKWDPRRYGNKLVTENTNTNFNTEVVDTDEMDRRLDRAIAAALAARSAVEPDPAGA